MTEEEFEKAEYAVEEYGRGYLVADYSGETPTPYGARYRGKSGVWNMQPIIDLNDVFKTKAEAIASV